LGTTLTSTSLLPHTLPYKPPGLQYLLYVLGLPTGMVTGMVQCLPPTKSKP